MPGLLFSVFRQLGVARMVAWTWMWVLPLAYGYATQAGSIGNDFTGAVFCLMSVHCGLRARRSGRVSDIWLAGLAAALMTGVKLSNLPLLLPCLVAVWPALGQLRKNLAGSVAVAGIAVLVSAAPTIVLNQAHTGSWNGDPQNLSQIQAKSPGAALLGNGLLLLQQSFMPPVLPGRKK
jgi:dolichyl-phosphate-mannose--protein O-mannosyl transferase